MSFQPRIVRLAALVLVLGAMSLMGQQKPQWLPGQVGLNAGIEPSPGFSYVNITVDYSSGRFNGPNGNAIPVAGRYDVWAIEDLFFYVAPKKVLGGNLGFMFMYPTPATGSLSADIPPPGRAGVTNINLSGGGTGLADLFIQPFTLGWHLKRVDFQVMDGFMIPTGRYVPGASNNIGTGYFGNHFMTGTTLYLTQNKGTSANLFTDWEIHGSRQGANFTSKTPGEAFTDEWGLGQVIPLEKNLSQLLQIGIVGYDQWQVTSDNGTVPVLSTNLTAPASIAPFYSVHAAGGQLTYIIPKHSLSFYFKYEYEYNADSHFLGKTIVFGGAWTLKTPKS